MKVRAIHNTHKSTEFYSHSCQEKLVGITASHLTMLLIVEMITSTSESDFLQRVRFTTITSLLYRLLISKLGVNV